MFPSQANQLLPPLRQPPAADSDAAAAADSSSVSASAAAGGSSGSSSAAAVYAVDEDELARSVGYFLRVCPGLSKVTIGELLGDPDKFFLKVCMPRRAVLCRAVPCWCALCCIVVNPVLLCATGGGAGICTGSCCKSNQALSATA